MLEMLIGDRMAAVPFAIGYKAFNNFIGVLQSNFWLEEESAENIEDTVSILSEGIW